MKLTFLGVGSAFSKINSNSNLLIESGDIKLLVDCGPTASRSIMEYGLSLQDITHIFITHLHADHIGGLEEFAFMCRLVFKTYPKVISTPKILETLWDGALRGGLEFVEITPQDETAQTMTDFFGAMPIHSKEWVSVDAEMGALELYMHPTNHVKGMESYALELKETSSNHRFLFTGDTKFDRTLIESCAPRCDWIFHDCQLFNAGNENILGVHASYQQLLSFPEKIRSKMWLYHYGDEQVPDAKKDQFAGFVQHLQSFSF